MRKEELEKSINDSIKNILKNKPINFNLGRLREKTIELVEIDNDNFQIKFIDNSTPKEKEERSRRLEMLLYEMFYSFYDKDIESKQIEQMAQKEVK